MSDEWTRERLESKSLAIEGSLYLVPIDGMPVIFRRTWRDNKETKKRETVILKLGYFAQAREQVTKRQIPVLVVLQGIWEDYVSWTDLNGVVKT